MEIKRNISKYNHYVGRNGQSIQYIVIHYVGALGGAEANASYYAGGNRGASAHYFVGFQGEIWQSVEDADGAWSVGGGIQGTGHSLYGKCTNYNSLNIEMCVHKKSTATMNATDQDWYFEDATVASTIALTKYLMNKYNIATEKVVRHYDVVGKICPNPYVYNTGNHTWAAFKEALAEQSAVKDFSGNTKPFEPYKVKVAIKDLNIRTGAGTTYVSVGYCPVGVYTIVEEKKANNFTWGRLKSGAGWIALDYTKKV